MHLYVYFILHVQVEILEFPSSTTSYPEGIVLYMNMYNFVVFV